MIRRWIGLAMCTALGACTQIEEMAMPVADKVNAAYPVAGEVRLAQDRLHTKLAADAKALEAAKAQFASRMSLRALSCTQHRSIGRLDSVATVRAMALPATCFQEQDQALQQFLGARLIGALMAGPPLRPLQPLGPFVRLPSAGMAHVYAATFAPEAGVALLRGPRGEHVAVQVPGGAQIAVLPQLAPTGFEARLSHNGRVVAFSTQGQGLVFVETETGSRILELPQAGSFVAWLAEVGGFVHAGTQGKLMLVDTATGASGPHPLALGNASWGLQLPGKASQLLLGNGRHIELISHERQTDGIRAVSIKQYPLAEGLSVSSRSPVPMLQGKRLVFQSMLDIGWLDLESGQSGAWKVAPPLEMPFAKIDETHLYLVSVARDRLTTQAWSFDIAAETVAPIDLAGIAVGALLPIGERAGVLRRSNEAWLGDAMPAGAPVPLAQLTGEYALQQQMAKLESQLQSQLQAQAQIQTPGRPLSPAEAQLQARLRAEGYPPGSGSPGQRWRDAGVAPVPVQAAPGLADAPRDAQVHIVGVYEGKSLGAGPANMPRPVTVNVMPSARPVVLVLASYSSVRWTVLNHGAQIAAVLLSGYEPSTVSGLSQTTTLRIGSQYAYAPNTAEYAKLREAVVAYTGPRVIRTFQGSYAGQEFTVGP